MLRKAPVVLGVLCPGSRVCFGVPTVQRGRLRQDPERWRGPATVIAKQGASRYFVAYRAEVLLIVREQMQRSSSIENAAAERIVDDMDFVSQDPDRSRTYQYVADEDAQPPIAPLRTTEVVVLQVADQQDNGTLTPFGTATPVLFRAMKLGAKCTDCGRFGHEAGELECLNPKDRPRIKPRRGSVGSGAPAVRELAALQEEPSMIEDQEVASTDEMGNASVEEAETVLSPRAADAPGEGTDEYMYETERQLTSEYRRRKLQERHIEEYDVQDTLKRQKYEEQPSGASRVA